MSNSKKIGILGGGQLGRMLALAGYPLGLQFRFLDPNPLSPVRTLGEFISAPYTDPEKLDEFCEGLDLISYEFENIPAESLFRLNSKVPILPSVEALELSQDRLKEKIFFQRLGIPTAQFCSVDSRETLDQALKEIGLPSVMKSCRMGYDGKGQSVIHEEQAAVTVWMNHGRSPQVLESFIPFEREVSQLAVRSRRGEILFYPLVENFHSEGILRKTIAPEPKQDSSLQEEARLMTLKIVEELDYVGVLAVEFFVLHGKLLANEFAPRVHNSGHWTMDGAVTSQFENHLRAITGLPLGETKAKGYSAMINMIGTLPEPEEVLKVPGAHLHLYEKAPKPGRKLGHLNVTANSLEELHEKLEQITGHL